MTGTVYIFESSEVLRKMYGRVAQMANVPAKLFSQPQPIESLDDCIGVITDGLMFGVNGGEFAKRARESGKTFPIYIITGDPERFQPYTDYVTKIHGKPVGVTFVKELIANLVPQSLNETPTGTLL